MIVYGIQSGQFIKVGVTNNMQKRMNAFRLHNPHPLKVVLRRTVKENYWIERRMHKLLSQYAVGREWFSCSAELVRAAFEEALKELIANRGTRLGYKIEVTREGWEVTPVRRPIDLTCAVAQIPVSSDQ